MRVRTYPSTFFFLSYSECLKHWKVSWNIQLGNMSSYFIDFQKRKDLISPQNVVSVLVDPSWCDIRAARSHRDSWQDPIQLCCCFTLSSFVFYARLSVKMSSSAVSDPIFMPFNQRLRWVSLPRGANDPHQGSIEIPASTSINRVPI